MLARTRSPITPTTVRQTLTSPRSPSGSVRHSAAPSIPAIVSGSQLPAFAGVVLDELFVYAYDGTTWSEVPFQIDEVDASGEFTTTEDALLDGNDELVFMVADAGPATGCPRLAAPARRTRSLWGSARW